MISMTCDLCGTRIQTEPPHEAAVPRDFSTRRTIRVGSPAGCPSAVVELTLALKASRDDDVRVPGASPNARRADLCRSCGRRLEALVEAALRGEPAAPAP